MIFDTHCHLGYDGDDPAPVHQRARECGVTQLLAVGIDLASSERARAQASRLAGVYYAAGLHPNDSGRFADEWSGLESLARRDDCVAIGETGLDFFREWTTPEQQIVAFERHLHLACELDKPIVVHCRDAFARVYEVLDAHPGVRGVMHCFSGDVAQARRAIDLGLHVSFAGPLTYPKNDGLRAVAAFVPADRVLVETDAPFLPPQGRRGKRNEPAFIVTTVETLAGIRGITFEAAATTTSNNARQLFGV